MWTFVFCEARGLPVAECDSIDLATVMHVVVEVLCDPLWPFTAFSFIDFLINENRVPRKAFDHGLQSNKNYRIIKNKVALLVDLFFVIRLGF